jgi:putative oxidoreductase
VALREALWQELGVQQAPGGVRFGDDAPLAAARRAITAAYHPTTAPKGAQPMTALATLHLVRPILRWLEGSQWLPHLLLRVFIGYFFFQTGWAKLGILDVMAERFAQWGIPMPAFNAVLSAYTECLGGALIVVGLATRLAAIPLCFNMIVAISVVNLRNVTEFNEFFDLSEPLYALVFLWLLFAGPGPVSLDHLLAKRFGRPGGRPAR